MNLPGTYNHIIPIQLRFADIDRLNHVNNACYLNFFELGRVKYFSQVLGDAVNWSQNGFVLARTEMDHLEPVFLNDEVFCYTRVTKLGNKSLTIENTVAKLTNNEPVPCATGLGILVAMDYTSNQSIQIPPEWRLRISGFEKNLI